VVTFPTPPKEFLIKFSEFISSICNLIKNLKAKVLSDLATKKQPSIYLVGMRSVLLIIQWNHRIKQFVHLLYSPRFGYPAGGLGRRSIINCGRQLRRHEFSMFLQEVVEWINLFSYLASPGLGLHKNNGYLAHKL